MLSLPSVGRARGYLGPAACPAGVEPLLKVVGAAAGDARHGERDPRAPARAIVTVD